MAVAVSGDEDRNESENVTRVSVTEVAVAVSGDRGSQLFGPSLPAARQVQWWSL
ncbi:hypothetical protein [Streptomonospora alba]